MLRRPPFRRRGGRVERGDGPSLQLPGRLSHHGGPPAVSSSSPHPRGTLFSSFRSAVPNSRNARFLLGWLSFCGVGGLRLIFLFLLDCSESDVVVFFWGSSGVRIDDGMFFFWGIRLEVDVLVDFVAQSFLQFYNKMELKELNYFDDF